MTDEKLENLIRTHLIETETPTRDSLAHLLSRLPEPPVTKKQEMRYTIQTATSNIINNIHTIFTKILDTRRIILIPSLTLIVLISLFTLSPRLLFHNESIAQLAKQDELIEHLGNDTDEDIILTSFDTTDIDDLGNITNEI